MAKRKSAASATKAASATVDTNASACSCFLEHAHVDKVWVDNSNGEFRLHEPHKKLADSYTVVERSEVDLEAYVAGLEEAAAS